MLVKLLPRLLRAIGLSTALLLSSSTLSAQDGVDGSREFVRIDPLQKTKLIYQGQEYRFSAANSYSMLKSKKSADYQFEMMKEMGTNALRMWGFWNGADDSLQPSRGNYPEQKWQLLDYVIAKASERKIKLIIPFANYWNDFGGIDTLNKWVGHPPEQVEYTDREVFYRDERSRELYKEYVLHVLNRRNTITGVLYKDDPTILMWEPMNEARGRSDPSGEVVAEWLAWASKLIKDNDPNHLVGSGTEGFFKQNDAFNFYPWQGLNPPPSLLPNGTIKNHKPIGSYFELDCKIPTIDLCSMHAWPFQWYILPADRPGEFMANWIDEHLRFMATSPAYNKPLYLAEFGYQIYRRDGEAALNARKEVFKNAYFKDEQKTLREDVAGVGFWNISDNQYPDPNSLTFDVNCPQDAGLCEIIKDFSRIQIRSSN